MTRRDLKRPEAKLSNLIGVQFNFGTWLRGLLSGEPEFENLEKYIELETRRSVDPGAESAMAVALSAITLGGLGAVAVFFATESRFLALLVGLTGIVFSIAWLIQHSTSVSPDDRAAAQVRRKARGFLWELRRWKHRRMLRIKLGGGIGELLDTAARYWLRAQAALTADNWAIQTAGTQWMGVKEKATSAMDTGMAKLLLLAQDAQSVDNSFLSPSFEGARQIVENMRELAKESEKLADRLRIEAADPSAPADELRSTLAEIRNLTEAEEELQQYTGPAGRGNY